MANKDKNTTTTPAAEAAQEIKAPERVTVIIPKPRNVVGDTECTVGVNGTMYQIQYDKPVVVPKNVADVIQSHLDLQEELAADIEAASKIDELANL